MDDFHRRKPPSKLRTLTIDVFPEAEFRICTGAYVEAITFTLQNVEKIHEKEPFDALRLLKAFLDALRLARFEQAQRVEKWRWRESNPRPTDVQARYLHA